MLYSDYYLSKNSEPNIKFVDWINNVEKNVLERFGFNLFNLPDEDYMGNFESGYEPEQMIQIIQESNGFIPIEHKNKKQRKN
jgi:hypothetical protein